MTDLYEVRRDGTIRPLPAQKRRNSRDKKNEGGKPQEQPKGETLMDTINEVQNTQNVTPAGGEQSASAADQKQAQKAESRAKLKKAGGKALSVVAETTAVAAQVTVLSFLAGAALTVGAAVGARIAGKYGFPISVAK